MKKILLFILALMGIFSSMACSDTTTQGSYDPNTTWSGTPTTIKFSWWGTTDRNVATYLAIQLFHEKYPMYRVEGDQSVWTGYQTTLYNRLERNREADVFQVNYNWLYSMYGEYYFLDLNTLDLDLSDWPEGEHDPLTINGKVLGVSLSETGYIFYLNKKIYDDAGITEMPKTWDQLIAAGQQIGASSNYTKFAIGRLDAQQVAILMFTWLSQKYGKNLISDDHKLNFTRDELEEGFAFINDLRSNNVLIPSNANDTHPDGPTNPNWVTYQNYGGILQWNTAVSEYENVLSDKSNLVTAGMFQQEEDDNLGSYKKVSMALAVSRRVANDPAKKAAVKAFIEFMTSDPDAVRILGVDRGVPSNSLAYNTLLESTDPVFTATREWEGHVIVQQNYESQISEGINLYIHPYYEHDVFRRIYELPIEKFLFGTYTANQAINEIISKFNSTLAQVMGG